MMLIPVLGSSGIIDLMHTAGKFGMQWETMNSTDFGGLLHNSDNKVCAICTTTQICMPYKSTESGLQKLTSKNEKTVSKTCCNHVFCYYCV